MNGRYGLHLASLVLLIIGGLNWLAVGLFQWDVGQLFGGPDAIVSRAIYILVGLAAVYEIVMLASGTDRVGTTRATSSRA